MPFEDYLEPDGDGNGQAKFEEDELEAQAEMDPNDLEPDVFDVEPHSDFEGVQS